VYFIVCTHTHPHPHTHKHTSSCMTQYLSCHPRILDKDILLNQTPIHTHTYTHTHTNTHTLTHTLTHTYTHTHTHTQTHTHTFMYDTISLLPSPESRGRLLFKPTENARGLELILRNHLDCVCVYVCMYVCVCVCACEGGCVCVRRYACV